MAEYLFTYGTLRPGLAPAELASAMSSLRPIGPGTVHGILYDFGAYPGAVLDPDSKTTITGIVYELPDDANALRQFDDYEDYNPDFPARSQYVRVARSVKLADGQSLDCWVYAYNRDPGAAPIIGSGKWG